MNKKGDDTRELIVVFKKETDLERAQALLKRSGVHFRKGMDSSRGKLYFYSTGPKFILTFESSQDEEMFISRHEGHDQIYEIYTPDWTKQKD